MKMVYGDFESYFENKTYTLRGNSMTTYEYILSDKWETIGCGIAEGMAPAKFYPGDTVADLLREYPRPWCFVSYNALFDASILSFRYGIYPDMLIDAMGMVRAVLLHKIRNGRVNLDNVAQILGLPLKDGEALKSHYHLSDYMADPPLWERHQRYCITDTENCRAITQRLAPSFPRSEIWVMDTILKMTTRPQFYGDINHLQSHYQMVVAEKEKLLSRVGCTKGDLLSSDKFADALRSFGVEPPMKPSHVDPTKEIYAFAKTDEAFRDLEEHENPDVQALMAARLGVKSTLEEKRTGRLIGMTQAAQRAFDVPFLPVPLRYGAAHTHRFGGEWKINLQNLPSRKTKKLRESLIAPPKHKVVAIDASQIEARFVAWLAGEEELLARYAAGEDVYSWFASDLFKMVVTKANKLERFIGKENILGLGFQMGPEKQVYHLRNKAADMGLDIEFTFQQCEVWVQFYRRKFKKIRNMWYALDDMLNKLIDYPESKFQVGPSHTDGTDLVLPSGLRLYYDNLRRDGGEKYYDYARERRKIYGGKYLENHVQHLDRAHVMETAARIDRRLKSIMINDIRLAHQVHDELIYVVPDGLVSTLGVIAYEEMKTPCDWGAGLPLDAEVKIGQSYGTLQDVNIAELRQAQF